MLTTPDQTWRRPPRVLYLPEDEVHVWRASLDLGSHQVQRLRGLLSKRESARCARFRFPQGRQRYTVTRGALRVILSDYLGLQPHQLRFGYGEYGKPALAFPAGQGRLTFNLSHSAGLAVYAIARRRQVGVDLEQVRPIRNAEKIAERFFSSRERAALRALPESQQQVAFFHCWTRKEAYIKGRGKGLGLPLDQFDVSFLPGDPVKLLATREDPEEAARWSLCELRPGRGYVAALAVEGHDWQLSCWQFPQQPG